MIVWAVLVLVVAGLAWGISRANEIAAFRIREGRLEQLRGELPPSVRHDFAEAVRLARIKSGRFRIVSRNGTPTIVTRIKAPVDQRLRNVCALHRHRMKRRR